jgi:hypothetical protein
MHLQAGGSSSNPRCLDPWWSVLLSFSVFPHTDDATSCFDPASYHHGLIAEFQHCLEAVVDWRPTTNSMSFRVVATSAAAVLIAAVSSVIIGL